MPSFADIQALHRADPPDDLQYIVRSSNLIVALRLRLSKNPRVKEYPAQVWVGDGPNGTVWGTRLAKRGGQIQLYVADTDDDDYTDLGAYTVIDRPHTPQELKNAQAQVQDQLTRIVYLNKA